MLEVRTQHVDREAIAILFPGGRVAPFEPLAVRQWKHDGMVKPQQGFRDLIRVTIVAERIGKLLHEVDGLKYPQQGCEGCTGAAEPLRDLPRTGYSLRKDHQEFVIDGSLTETLLFGEKQDALGKE
jgi:hypothetical protein